MTFTRNKAKRKPTSQAKSPAQHLASSSRQECKSRKKQKTRAKLNTLKPHSSEASPRSSIWTYQAPQIIPTSVSPRVLSICVSFSYFPSSNCRASSTYSFLIQKLFNRLMASANFCSTILSPLHVEVKKGKRITRKMSELILLFKMKAHHGCSCDRYVFLYYYHKHS